jgi:hypothetical protein
MDTITFPSRELEVVYDHVLETQWYEELKSHGEAPDELEVPLLSNITLQGDQTKMKKSWARHFLSIYDDDYDGEEQVAEWPAVTHDLIKRGRLTLRTVRL